MHVSVGMNSPHSSAGITLLRPWMGTWVDAMDSVPCVRGQGVLWSHCHQTKPACEYPMGWCSIKFRNGARTQTCSKTIKKASTSIALSQRRQARNDYWLCDSGAHFLKQVEQEAAETRPVLTPVGYKYSVHSGCGGATRGQDRQGFKWWQCLCLIFCGTNVYIRQNAEVCTMLWFILGHIYLSILPASGTELLKTLGILSLELGPGML